MAVKPIEFVMADGVTKLTLRPITKHPDDKEIARQFYHVEQFANQVAEHLKQAAASDDAARITKLTELAAELRIVRDDKFAKFLQVYLRGVMPDADILGKVVAQCGEEEMDFILAVVRSGLDFASRELEALTLGSPVQTFETILRMLKSNEAGKAYLLDLCEQLKSELTPSSTPSGTLPPAS